MKNILLSSFAVLCFLSADGQVNQSQKLANLNTFSKVYGYVRYFHPSEEASKVDWEQFLYYGTKEVENAPNNMVLKEKLNKLFNPIAPAVLISDAKGAAAFSIKSITPSNATFNKNIAWQHLGLGTGPGLYKSIRTNRPVAHIDMTTRGFGNATTSINASPYRGKKIRLTAHLKAEVTSGQAQMWLRVDKADKTMGFFDNMDSRPVKSPQWKVYETVGYVDQDASAIVFGSFLRGMGKMWLDGVKLEIEQAGKWTIIPLINPSFEDAAEEGFNGWFGESPGYIYRMVSEDVPDGKTALLIADNTTYKVQEKLFDTEADFGTTITKDVGNGIYIVVPLVLKGTDNDTYPAGDLNKISALKESISKAQPALVEDKDLYVRLSGIAIAWNIFQHFYPYHTDVKTEWSAQLPKGLKTAYEAKTPEEYLHLLAVLTETLQDGHVFVSGGNNTNYYNIPLAAKFVEGKLVISAVDSTGTFKNDSMPKRGDIITQIDGKPAMDRFNELRNITSGSPQWKEVRALSELLNGQRGSALKLRYQSAGVEKELSLQRDIIRNVKDTVTIKNLNNGIYYLNIGTTEMKDIKARLNELEAAKAIICDLRGYPRNNHEFINYLLTVNDTNKWMFVPQISRPDFENVKYAAMGWALKPSDTHLNAKIIFLTSGGAISYAESYMGFIKQYKLASIVGQPTAGANGNVNSFTLPGGYNIRFTGMRVKQQDGSQLQAIGIQPDVYVKETIKGIAEGRDEFMEKAMELLLRK